MNAAMTCDAATLRALRAEGLDDLDQHPLPSLERGSALAARPWGYTYACEDATGARYDLASLRWEPSLGCWIASINSSGEHHACPEYREAERWAETHPHTHAALRGPRRAGP